MLEIQRQLMEALLDGEDPVLTALRSQYASAQVERAETTDVGFFVHFKVPRSMKVVDPPNFDLGDVWFKLAGAQEDGGLVLFIREGRLDMLEGFNWTDPWPEAPRLEAFGYLAVSERRRDQQGREQVNLVPSESRDLSYLASQIHQV